MKAPATKFLAHYSIWLGTFMMIIMGVLLFTAGTRQIEASRWINHTQDVLQSITEINEFASRAESAQRGYLLSGSDTFIPDRDQALKKLNDGVARVRKLTTDNAVQQRRTQELENLVAIRTAIMQENAQLRGTNADEAAQIRAAARVGQQASARIYDSTAELKQEELRLLEMRRADLAELHEIERNLFIAAVLIGVLVLIAGYLGFARQARAREQMEQRLRAMADSLPGAMYQLRHPPHGTPIHTFMSAGVNNLYGGHLVKRAHALPAWDSVVNAIDERDRAQFVAALAAAVDTVAPFRHDYRVKHPDGAVRWLHHEASLQKLEDGSIVMNGYIADITKQRQLEEALQDAKEVADSANRAKSTFLATMSHEIRTPMNGVLGMLELLSLSKLNGEQRTTLDIVCESGKSLLRIIDDILDFSKIEAGKLEVRPEPTSIKDVVEHVHNIYAGNASSKGLTMKRSVDRQISPALLVDQLRLRQILNNFVSNALKFTNHGSIEITADLIERVNDQERVRFSVKDTGIGISAANQQRLFQPFSQGDDDAVKLLGGTGLGLTICRRLANVMGGSVDVISEPGKGTTMLLTLSLPVADAKAIPKIDVASKHELLSSTTKMRRLAPSVAKAEAEGTLVLLVDDHPINRTLLTRQVRALGYAAEAAENGVEALEKWKSERFALVITDCNMPEMGGYELARRIRRAESENGGKRIPIIACTANALVGDAELCYDAGMDDYLVKPVELSHLLEKLDEWLPIPSKARAHPVKRVSHAASAPMDPSILGEISSGDAAVEREIVADFRRVNDGDVAALKQAVAARDVAQIARATHRIVGASRMVGALDLANVCEPVAAASRASDWKAVAAAMETVQVQWVRLNAYLDSVRRGSQSEETAGSRPPQKNVSH